MITYSSSVVADPVTLLALKICRILVSAAAKLDELA
jgi:hypothetical protein